MQFQPLGHAFYKKQPTNFGLKADYSLSPNRRCLFGDRQCVSRDTLLSVSDQTVSILVRKLNKSRNVLQRIPRCFQVKTLRGSSRNITGFNYKVYGLYNLIKIRVTKLPLSPFPKSHHRSMYDVHPTSLLQVKVRRAI